MSGDHAETVTAAAKVSLREITRESVRRITALEVGEDQRRLVSSNAVSIAQAHFEKGAWFRAIYADDTPVGFAMLFDPTLPGALPHDVFSVGEVCLWRFMVDRRYQGLGFGRQALDLIRAHVRNRPGIRRLLSYYVPAEPGPEGFYLKYGFTKTGRTHNGEVEIEISP